MASAANKAAVTLFYITQGNVVSIGLGLRAVVYTVSESVRSVAHTFVWLISSMSDFALINILVRSILLFLAALMSGVTPYSYVLGLSFDNPLAKISRQTH